MNVSCGANSYQHDSRGASSDSDKRKSFHSRRRMLKKEGTARCLLPWCCGVNCIVRRRDATRRQCSCNRNGCWFISICVFITTAWQFSILTNRCVKCAPLVVSYFALPRLRSCFGVSSIIAYLLRVENPNVQQLAAALAYELIANLPISTTGSEKQTIDDGDAMHVSDKLHGMMDNAPSQELLPPTQGIYF